MTVHRSAIISRIRKRVDVEENSFQFIALGPTGSGKSLSVITFLKTLDPYFDESRIVFTPEDFLRLINSNLPPGSAILCDEIGSWMGSREWYSLQNKLMSITLQTYRFKRYIVGWTLPNMKMVDVHLRDLAHAIIETVKIDRKVNQCICKFKYRTINPLSGKGYEKFPVTRNANGERVTLTRIRINRPAQELEDAYLKKKERHLKTVYEDIERTLRNIKKPRRVRSKKKKKDLIKKEIKKGRLKPSEIARKYKTSPGYVREIKNQVLSAEL